MKYEFLSEDFLEAMNDIGRYGFEKYGDASFHAKRLRGDRDGLASRGDGGSCLRHARAHIDDYEAGLEHDHFGTRKHQLAAAAFNCLMECYLAELEKEETNVPTI